jgi:alpha-D-ribose 1-methylphosphonate 5-phosphate C-P lyase
LYIAQDQPAVEYFNAALRTSDVVMGEADLLKQNRSSSDDGPGAVIVPGFFLRVTDQKIRN